MNRSTRVRALLVLLLQALLSHANGQVKKSAEALALIDQANALPAEFRADSLLWIAESTLITDVSWKKELIEQAYWSGARASLPYAQIAEGSADSVTANSVRTNRLEALTLQSRAIEVMLTVDPAKALDLFEQLPPTDLPKLTCANAATPNLVDYYRAAVDIFQTSFTTSQRAKGKGFDLLQRVTGTVDSPSEVWPVLEMIFTAEVTVVQRRDLVTLLAARLQEIWRSDREYGAAESLLVTALERVQPPDAIILLPALRVYILKHVSTNRCTDNIPGKGQMSPSAAEFNVLVKKFDPDGSRYKLITLEEAKPAGAAGTYAPDLIGTSADSQAVTEDLRWLKHQDKQSTNRWRTRYDETARLVHELKNDDESSPEAFFCMKADALNELATLAPSGPMRDAAMDEYREFLEEHYSAIQNPNLWFTMFRHMLYTARFAIDEKTKDWMLNQLVISSNPVISLYAKLELKLGRPRRTYPISHIVREQF